MKKGELNKEEIKLLIVSYLSRTISDADLDKLDEWIKAGNKNRAYFNELKNSWILSGGRNSESQAAVGESWNNFSQKLTPDRLVPEYHRNRRMAFAKYLRLAATWLLIFGLGSALTFWMSRSHKPVISESSQKTIEISTPLGARSFIRMPDSTQIWLNAGTTITYSQDYGEMTRTLNLNGEAYFKVAKDSKHPFIVNTQGIVVRALGTRFNVKAYPEEKTISATLEEGKIDVSILNSGEKNESVLLKPKEKLIFYKKTKESETYTESSEGTIKPEGNRELKLKDINVLSNVRTELFTSWKDARWIIDREPLNSLAPMLERRFNLVILFEDEQIKKFKFTGTIENETVDQILSALRFTAPVDYQITKDTIRLSLNMNAKEEFKRIMIKNR